MTENPVATEFPDKDEKKRGGKKEKSKKKGNVAHIYCMMFQITALGKINLPATKMCNPLRNGGGRGGQEMWLQIPALVEEISLQQQCLALGW